MNHSYDFKIEEIEIILKKIFDIEDKMRTRADSLKMALLQFELQLEKIKTDFNSGDYHG